MFPFSSGLFFWLFSNLWWTQTSSTLSFYSNISTYCHMFSSKYCYFIPEGLVCMVYTVLATEVRCSDLLQEDELWGHSRLTASAPPLLTHCGIFQGHAFPDCQGQWLSTARLPERDNFAGCGTPPRDSLDVGTAISVAEAFSGLGHCLKFSLCNPPIFFSLFTDVSLTSQSEGSRGRPPLPLYPSKAFPQSSSCTSNSVFVST